MPKNEFMDLVKKVVITALIFAAFHLTGYLLNMVIFKLGTKGSYMLPFGFFIYQGLISYPPFMFIILLIALRLNRNEFLQSILILISLLSQRSASLLYSFFFILKEKRRWVSYILVLIIFMFVLGFYDAIMDPIFGRFLWRVETGTLEAGRISNWSIIFSEFDSLSSILIGPQIFGNTLHNYWLNLTNHTGLFGLTFFIIMFFLLFLRSSILIKSNFNYNLPFLFWFLVDTNVNSPLSQMYIQSIFCIFLIFNEKWEHKFAYEKSKIFNFKFPIEIDIIKITKFLSFFIIFLILGLMYLNVIGFENEYFIHVF